MDAQRQANNLFGLINEILFDVQNELSLSPVLATI